MFNGIKRTVKRGLLDILLPHLFYFRINGHCPCCEREVEFLANHPWLRDEFHCQNCDSLPRNRALMLVLERSFPRWRELRIHESSPSAGGASARLQQDCRQYTGTQFHPDAPPGAMVGAFRNENLGAQTFADGAFDVVITQDVMEHVLDPDQVFQEIARTLSPGGAHVFTVPLVNKHRPSETWAVAGPSGEVRFLHEAEYHGNPVDPQGSPVTMHWGYDIGLHIEAACGLKTDIETLDDLHHGVRAEYIEVLVTHKPAA